MRPSRRTSHPTCKDSQPGCLSRTSCLSATKLAPARSVAAARVFLLNLSAWHETADARAYDSAVRGPVLDSNDCKHVSVSPIKPMKILVLLHCSSIAYPEDDCITLVTDLMVLVPCSNFGILLTRAELDLLSYTATVDPPSG